MSTDNITLDMANRSSFSPSCSVKCGGPMDGWWRCGEPPADSSGRCTKHTLFGRRFTLDELRELPTGLGVHVEFHGKVCQNYSLLSVDFDAGTAVVNHRSGHGKGGAKRAARGLPVKAPTTRSTVPVASLIKPRCFKAWPVSKDRQLGFIFDSKKMPILVGADKPLETDRHVHP